MKKDVILVYAGKPGMPNPELPLSIIYLGWALQKSGYNPKLLDMRVSPYDKVDFSKALCVGISVTTNTVSYALDIAKHVRKIDASLPIIWGGVHPSLLPVETAENEYVDIAVRGEGELTLVEILQKLEAKESLASVKGVTYRNGNEIKTNPDREFMDLKIIDAKLPYHLLDLEGYPYIKKGSFSIQTSRGCPHRCGFCYNLSFNKRNWRAKSAEQVLEEIKYLVEEFKVNKIYTMGDDEYFINRQRIEEICEGLLRENIGIGWGSFCRFDRFSKYDKPFIDLIEKSGCLGLTFGGESGSPQVLTAINKDITIDQIITSTKKMAQTNMMQIVSFMCGLPGETEKDLEQTFNLVDLLLKINPKVIVNGIVTYTPYPGTSLYDLIVREYGFKPPQSLQQWADYSIYGNINAPWVDKKRQKLLETVSIMTRFVFYGKHYNIAPHIRFKHIYRMFNFLARTRWSHKYFGFPIEWMLVKKMLKYLRGYV